MGGVGEDPSGRGQTGVVRVRDWTGADYYRELGVAPTATRDEISAAYRARARVLHPDTGAVDPASEQAFVRAATAYQILTGPMREEYDRARRRGQVRRPVPVPASSATGGTDAVAAATGARSARAWPATRQGARGALWGGLALVVAGFLAAAVVITLQVRDARLRDDGLPAQAVVVRDHGVPRLEFVTKAGTLVRTDLPDSKSGGMTAGDIVDVRYDREDPQRVVTARSTVGRDVTLWLVAAKLLIVGTVLAIVGGRRLLKLRTPERDG